MKGINPQILLWARQETGLSIEDVAGHFKKDPEFIENWEKGLSSPSFPQLEKLAKKYKRPTAIFFFPEVPQEESLKNSFRTLPEQDIQNIQPHLRFLIRKARAMQINLSELNNDSNPSNRFLLHNFNVENKPLDVVARELRDYLGIDLNTQKQYRNPEKAFKEWRSAVEKHGVFVFKDAFKDRRFSGFCLYDDVFPVIYINNSLPPPRQIFTLFHELAHLLFKTSYIEASSLGDRESLNRLSEYDKEIEVFCNAFADEFLVPDDDFRRRDDNFRQHSDADFIQHSDADFDDRYLQHLAEEYSVSREVILRKFSDNGTIDSEFYNKKVRQWSEVWEAQKQRDTTAQKQRDTTAQKQRDTAAQKQRDTAAQKQHDKTKTSGGNSISTKRAYLGENYIEMAFSQYYKENISIEQLADYLDVKVGRIPKMGSLIFEEQGRS